MADPQRAPTDGAGFDVVAIGAAIVDILAKVEDGFLAQNAIAKGGMTLVDSARADALHGDMPVQRAVCGGSAANTAAGLAALGARVAFAGKTKDDAMGRVFRDDLATLGVAHPTAPFPADADGATARCMVMVTPDAQRSMCTDLGVSGLFGEAEIPREEIAAAKVLYLEGYLWDREETKAAFKAAMDHAKAHGGRVALTLSDTFCVERHRDSFREIVAGPVDILFANEAEILALYETDDVEIALARATADAPVAVVTRSEKGCVALSRTGSAPARADQPAEPIDALVDTTGAGDMFAAGFLYGLTQGRPLSCAARMGCLAAAEVIQHLGARPESDLRALFARKGLIDPL
ncbi:MAG: adenosine kinase [Pseudomonadota bacterium]